MCLLDLLNLLVLLRWYSAEQRGLLWFGALEGLLKGICAARLPLDQGSGRFIVVQRCFGFHGPTNKTAESYTNLNRRQSGTHLLKKGFGGNCDSCMTGSVFLLVGPVVNWSQGHGSQGSLIHVGGGVGDWSKPGGPS